MATIKKATPAENVSEGKGKEVIDLKKCIKSVDGNKLHIIKPKLDPITALPVFRVVMAPDPSTPDDKTKKKFVVPDIELSGTTVGDVLQSLLVNYKPTDFKTMMIQQSLSKKVYDKNNFLEIDSLDEKAFIQQLIVDNNVYESYVLGQMQAIFGVNPDNFKEVKDENETKDIFIINNEDVNFNINLATPVVFVNGNNSTISKLYNNDDNLPEFVDENKEALKTVNEIMTLKDVIQMSLKEYKTKDVRKRAILEKIRENIADNVDPLYIVEKYHTKLMIIRIVALNKDLNDFIKGFTLMQLEAKENDIPELYSKDNKK